MDHDSYHLQTLVQLGLTQNQGRLYLSLLTLGKTTASLLSKETHLARQEVYRLLQELHDAGLVQKTVDTPIDFEAVAIRDCISTLMQIKTLELEKTTKRVESLANRYSFERALKPEQDFKFLLVPPKQVARRKIETMLRNAKKSVQLITTTRRFSQGMARSFGLYIQNLEDKINARIVVIIGEELASDVSKRLSKLENYSTFSIRFVTQNEPSIIIVDKCEATVNLCPKTDYGASPLFWTNHPELLAVYDSYFESVWGKAKEFPLEIKEHQ